MDTSSARTSQLALVVDGAEKHFDDVHALAGASLTVERGEILGLLGPNGAGKTTLIKAIAGRLVLDGGAIRLFGQPVSRDDKRLDIGVVPQELALYKLLTAQENLEVFGKLYGVARGAIAGRVKWALDWSGLADRSREPIRRFSGGMLRRLNIACSLLHAPTLLLLDEPTVGVDPQSRERIYEMLAELERQDVSMVLTTHHLEEAERRCRRIVIIDHGKTVASGTLAELTSHVLGGGRTLTLTLSAPLAVSAALPADTTISEDRREVRSRIADVARDVPERLALVATAGGLVENLDLSGGTLQDVFIALTGRELRE